MNQCYSFKEYLFDDPIFKTIDATYIIHLENNGRLSNIEQQLLEFHPTKKVYIVFNKGYKNCQKKEYIDTPAKDLIDVFYTIFNDSRNKNYNNILILEDDFQFSNKINETTSHSISIDTFLKDYDKDEFVYYLGCLSWLQSDFNMTHPRINLSTGTHACIYSKKCIDYFLDKVEQKYIADWDIYLNFGVIPRYKYYIPLCYQTFPDTENSKSWHRGSEILLLLVFLQRSLFKSLGLDRNAEPGFSIMEASSRILFWILLFLLIFGFYKLYKFIIK
jgi:hypothetical protein